MNESRLQRTVWGSRMQPLVSTVGGEKPLNEGTEKACLVRLKCSREVQLGGP